MQATAALADEARTQRLAQPGADDASDAPDAPPARAGPAAFLQETRQGMLGDGGLTVEGAVRRRQHYSDRKGALDGSAL